MQRAAIFAYGVIAYAVFLGTFLYAVGFIGNFATLTTLDGPATMRFLPALFLNVGLLTLFAIQHSLMARPAFKRWWTQFVPQAAERSTYVLLSSLALIAMFYYWQPLGGTIWNVANPLGQALLFGIFGLGWVIVLLSTFLINHFDLFGLRQVTLNLLGKPYTPLQFKTPWLYRYVRHPLYVGWFLAFWATPTMTAAHLLFAVMTSIYILIAIQFEERDLVDHLGEDYVEYRKRVPMLVPRLSQQTRKLKPA
jgi:protein-S-isoprenylcysteine O-methyltransferase Ste14